MPAPFRIAGYAIVSSDGMIADAHAAFPQALVFEADKQFYARELDRVDAVIQGRHSHEGQANSPLRRRLILTRNRALPVADRAQGALELKQLTLQFAQRLRHLLIHWGQA